MKIQKNKITTAQINQSFKDAIKRAVRENHALNLAYKEVMMWTQKNRLNVIVQKTKTIYKYMMI